MRATLTLGWQNLISKIHPPLSTTTRESQKLLKTLNVSFQKYLDEQHPSSASTEHNSATFHLQSILANPLLEVASARSAQKSKSAVSKSKGLQINNIQKWTENPQEMFRDHASTGAATLNTAKTSLRLQLRSCLQSPLESPAIAMAETRISRQMTDWLWSSGMEESGAFFNDREFLRLLTAFLVAEQRYGTIYHWWRRLRSPLARGSFSSLAHDRTLAQATLLHNTVKAECNYGAGLEGAMMHFVQLFKRVPNFGRREERVFRPSGHYLSNCLANAEQTENISSKILGDFIETATKWSSPTSFISAWQQAYHPYQPSADSGFFYLTGLSDAYIVKLDEAKRKSHVQLGIRIADVYLRTNNSSRAEDTIHFIKRNFPREIGLSQETSATQIFQDDSQDEYDRHLIDLQGVAG